MEAKNFYYALIKRLKKFNLEIAEDKSKILPFGRFAVQNNKQQGKGKPGTFDFLGFTHYCSQSRGGRFRVKRKTSAKKVRAKLKECKEWLKANRTTNIHIVIDRFQRSLKGYYNYYCITDNLPHVNNFRDKIKSLFFKWMNRRSQKKSFNYGKFGLFLNRYPLPLPKVKVSIYELREELNYIL